MIFLGVYLYDVYIPDHGVYFYGFLCMMVSWYCRYWYDWYDWYDVHN